MVPKCLLRSKDTGKKQKLKQEIVPSATQSGPWSPEAQKFMFPDISAGQMVHLPPLSQDACSPLLPLPLPPAGTPMVVPKPDVAKPREGSAWLPSLGSVWPGWWGSFAHTSQLCYASLSSVMH